MWMCAIVNHLLPQFFTILVTHTLLKWNQCSCFYIKALKVYHRSDDFLSVHYSVCHKCELNALSTSWIYILHAHTVRKIKKLAVCGWCCGGRICVFWWILIWYWNYYIYYTQKKNVKIVVVWSDFVWPCTAQPTKKIMFPANYKC